MVVRQALELQKEQYEYWLKRKTEEVKTFVTDYETFKVEKMKQLNEVSCVCGGPGFSG